MKKVALITGAGSGIGRATALAFVREGYCVVLAGRRKEALEQTAAQAPAGSEVLVVPTDVGDPIAVRGAVRGRGDLRPARRALQQRRRGGRRLRSKSSRCEQWKAVVNVNLTGAFLCTQEASR